MSHDRGHHRRASAEGEAADMIHLWKAPFRTTKEKQFDGKEFPQLPACGASIPKDREDEFIFDKMEFFELLVRDFHGDKVYRDYLDKHAQGKGHCPACIEEFCARTRERAQKAKETTGGSVPRGRGGSRSARGTRTPGRRRSRGSNRVD